MAASRQTGKPVRAMLRELVGLRRHGVNGRMYIRYRLFDDARYTAEQKRQFTGSGFRRPPTRP
jgi:hypothetical protein